jgi:hypothetical protein
MHINLIRKTLKLVNSKYQTYIESRLGCWKISQLKPTLKSFVSEYQVTYYGDHWYWINWHWSSVIVWNAWRYAPIDTRSSRTVGERRRESLSHQIEHWLLKLVCRAHQRAGADMAVLRGQEVGLYKERQYQKISTNLFSISPVVHLTVACPFL